MKRTAALFLALLLAYAVPAAAAEAPASLIPEAWLLLDPVPAPLPAFHDETPGGFGVADLLENPSRDPALPAPRAGDADPRPGAPARTWRVVEAAGGLDLAAPDAATPAEAWLSLRLESDRWRKTTLELAGAHPVAAWLDGETVALKEKDDGAAREGELTLTMGKHALLLLAVYDPEESDPWRVAATLALSDGAGLDAGVDPRRETTIRDILDAPRVDEAVISADGARVACVLGANLPDGKAESWIEIRDAEDGRLLHARRGDDAPSGLAWAPTGSRLSFSTTGEEGGTIWILDLDGGAATPLLRDVPELGAYAWAPDGASIVYGVTEKPDPDPRHVHRLREVDDRLPWFRDRTRLVQVAVPGGASRRLTAGDASPFGWRISPAGDRLLFFRDRPDYAARPYVARELVVLDLATLETHRILDDPWIDDARWSPDGRRLLLQGSPSAFGGLGRAADLPDGVTPNDYGGQLYVFDPATGEAEPITLDFDPSVADCSWHRDGRIYARATDGQSVRLFLRDGKEWRALDAGVEVVSAWDPAREARKAVALGSGAVTPQKVVVMDLRRNRARVVLDPGAARFRDVTFGRVEDFRATLPNGEVLDGRVHYPRDYDPAKRYPAIVYYYGGTSPITRDFGGRYPKNVWTGQGYFVYVPEPSGALGYGQAFAARHVNDWGRLTADEVIEGTRAFLEAHAAVDPERVGCMGASYGGFLTEYLLTRTDIFACGVSHAGISSLSSYWGEGYWGYNYGVRALANAFPWNDRELYVEQSPLFHADKITTPLLMLHGDADPNVPLGESDQLFAALKLLGRDVEYVRVGGQQHWILERGRRIVWNDTILAYLARYLKGRPEWWNALYPDPGAAE